MFVIDVATVVSLSFISYVVCTLFLVQLWRQNRGRFAGLGLWIFHFALQAVALVMILLRGAIPDWASILIANTLIFAGVLLIYIGLERFVGRPGGHLHDLLLLAASACAYWFYSVVHPDLNMRILVFSVYSVIICLECIWLLWRRVAPEMRSLTFGVGMVFGGYLLVSVVRLLKFFFGDRAGDDFFRSGSFDAAILLCYQTLTIVLTYSLVLMVNRRLISDAELQREKFAIAFHAAPYAIAVTRAADGTLLDVNETFESMWGYSRVEVVGRKSAELHLWASSEDRRATIEALSRTGATAGVEQRFRKKSGEVFDALLTAQPIEVEGERCVLACIADISRRKEIEAALQRESEALRERNEELDKFNRLAVGRELDMIALKRQVNALSRQLGQAPPYALAFAEAQDSGETPAAAGTARRLG